MIEILTRKQFRQHFKLSGLADWDSPLWIPETDYRPSRHFVCMAPVKYDAEFTLWCTKNCRGQLLCYSSSESEEWWGFTHHADIMYFILKWA
jgi:hypothetical protein